MSDLFDEVDDILGDVGSESAVSSEADMVEKNFNDSELQDIMAEIESLEKEFEAEDVPVTEAVLSEVEPEPTMIADEEVVPFEATAPVKQTDLQSEIDRELEMSLEIRDQLTEEAPASILSFESSSTSAPKTVTAVPSLNAPSAEISFEAHGQMNLNLGFKIGEETAKLSIDPIKGLVIVMSGVELCINSEDGCKVTMDSGVKFTIPLTSSESALKKKAA